MNEFKNYHKRAVQPMRPYVAGESLAGVSVNAEDTPGDGGMIAVNPNNPRDQWYVAKQFFQENYILLNEPDPEAERCPIPDSLEARLGEWINRPKLEEDMERHLKKITRGQWGSNWNTGSVRESDQERRKGMSDPCKPCDFTGSKEDCLANECFLKVSWFGQMILAALARSEAQREAIKKGYDVLEAELAAEKERAGLRD